jgi:hypothetical protein
MESINICYWGSNGNWGDEVNKIICAKISGKAVNKISTEEEIIVLVVFYNLQNQIILKFGELVLCIVMGDYLMHQIKYMQ